MRLDAAIGYFNLRGWRELADAVDDMPQTEGSPKARILIGMASDPHDELRRELTGRGDGTLDNATRNTMRQQARDVLREQLTIGLPTAADERALRRLRAQMDCGDVAIKLHLAHRLHAKLYICHRVDDRYPRLGYVGSSNLTFAGLGGQGELNVDVPDADASAKLSAWFEDRWEDPSSVDVTGDLLSLLDECWARSSPPEPYLVYLKMAYHLSQEARDGLIAYGLPTDLRATLLEHQAVAAQFAAGALDRLGGVMIGDVVGLGKTLVAVAVARLRQDAHGGRVLVVCPKNLKPMWGGYCDAYDLRHEVVELSMAIKRLSELKGRYSTVVVDESHNLRNRKRKDYQEIKGFIEDNDSKVMLLTATPYNIDFTDVANQLALFVAEEGPLGVSPETAIAEYGVEQVTRRLDCGPDSLAAFRRSDFPEDWERLMDRYMVRRTRRSVERSYGVDGVQVISPDGGSSTHPADGCDVLIDGAAAAGWDRVEVESQGARIIANGDESFIPGAQVRVAVGGKVSRLSAGSSAAVRRCLRVGDSLHLMPRRRAVSVIYDPGPDTAIASDETLDDINALDLPRYRLIDYLAEDADKRGDLTGDESAVIKSWREQPQRNLNLIGFARTLIYKRLGSSGPALISTLRRHRLRNDILLLAIDRGQDLPTMSSSVAVEPSPTDIDDGAGDEELPGTDGRVADAEAAYLRLIASDKVKRLRPLLFTDRLRDTLRSDNQLIDGILGRIGDWDQKSDTKLDALAGLACGEHGSEKVVVFSEYADTAAYIAGAFAERGIDSVEAVTGSDANPTLAARRFSPLSNATLGGMPKHGAGPIRVLVSTDVLSEGQNLQDARVVVNYDLPWAVVRIVQRAGRVDRIGQTANEVVVASMLPPGGVEEVIGNHRRIRERLDANAVVFGGGERFFGTDDEEAALPRRHLQRGPARRVRRRSRRGVDGLRDMANRRNETTPTKPQKQRPSPTWSTPPSPEPGRPTSQECSSTSRPTTRSTRSPYRPRQAARRTPSQPARRCASPPANPTHQAAGTLETHHELLAAAFNGPLRSPAAAAERQLSGVRSRCWNRLRALPQQRRPAHPGQPAMGTNNPYRRTGRPVSTAPAARRPRKDRHILAGAQRRQPRSPRLRPPHPQRTMRATSHRDRPTPHHLLNGPDPLTEPLRTRHAMLQHRGILFKLPDGWRGTGPTTRRCRSVAMRRRPTVSKGPAASATWARSANYWASAGAGSLKMRWAMTRQASVPVRAGAREASERNAGPCAPAFAGADGLLLAQHRPHDGRVCVVEELRELVFSHEQCCGSAVVS